MKLRLKENYIRNFCFIFQKAFPMVYMYSGDICCDWSTAFIYVQQNVSDRCTCHDVRFNWKPLSNQMVAMSNSVWQTFNPNNQNNQLLNMYGVGGSALISEKLSCLLILFGVHKFSRLSFDISKKWDGMSVLAMWKKYSNLSQKTKKKQTCESFFASEKSSLVDRLWSLEVLKTCQIPLCLWSPAAMSRVWFRDGLW